LTAKISVSGDNGLPHSQFFVSYSQFVMKNDGKKKKMVTFAGHDCFDSIYIACFSMCSTDCLADT
jgi:hypothetical protein